MANRVVYYGPPDDPRSIRARELAPEGIAFAIVDPGLPWDQRRELLAHTEAIISGGGAPSLAEMDDLPALKLLQLMSAGYDRVDVPAVKERGVVVARTSPQIAASVSQLAVGLMIAVLHRMGPGIDGARDGTWLEKPRSRPIFELMGKTVGIVGFGNIGREVARRLAGFDCDLIYYDSFDIPEEVEKALFARGVDFDELLRVSDVVTAHMPLYSGSRGMFNARVFSLMKDTAIFINTCRGPVHNERDLIDALRDGRIAGAGLDVLEEEPADPSNPLLHMDNVVVTPHIGGSSEERIERALVFSFENARRVMDGEEPLGQIQPLV